MKNIKLYDILVCEDIRREVGGQHTIVGLVSELNVNVIKGHKGEVKIPLSFMIRLSNFKNGIELKEIIVNLTDGKKNNISRKVIMGKKQVIQKHFNIAIIKEPIQFVNSTELSFEIKVIDMKGKSHILSNDFTFKINLIDNK
ncbi:MAG: hypothetical protein PF487_06825 [Bacteroidales bacterium]|jgi:hypothetical protein|nr:hypothetical protein [Bacteroidales bacterium]